MKGYILVIVTLLFSCQFLNSAIVKYDNGEPRGSYSNQVNWEEYSCLKADGPCTINKIMVYLSGAQTCLDTIRVTGDVSDGGMAATWFVNYINTHLIIPFEFTESGWYEFDVSEHGLRYDGGTDRVIISHMIRESGPFYTIDKTDVTVQYSSLLCNVFEPNPDFYNLMGTFFQQTAGNFMVRLDVTYDMPEGETSAEPPAPTLVDVTEEAGILDTLGNKIKRWTASVTDWNNDGWDDISIGPNMLQNNGDGTFKNIAPEMGIFSTGHVWADIDNDGNIDCYAFNAGPNDAIWWGDGTGNFTKGINPTDGLEQPGVTPIWFDYNKDGLLDLFYAYGRKEVNGNETYFPDQLFKNIDGRTFENVTQSSGIAAAEPAPYYDCWGASVCDYNSDGWPDIYVNTYRLGPDLLYHNNGDGTFIEVGSETGAIGAPTHDPEAFGHGMGSDWGDFDNDGDYDVAIGNLAHYDQRGYFSNRSLVLKNLGNNEDYMFEDVTAQMGVKFFEMNGAVMWVDLDLDGYLDLVHAQYAYKQKGEYLDRFARFYLNEGPDKDYQLKDMTWFLGAYCHGAWSPVRLDYDHDGDMDVLMASDKDNVMLFRNDIENKGNWITIKLDATMAEGIPGNGFGSSVELIVAGGQKQYRYLPGTVMTGRCSQNSNDLNFGLGDAILVHAIKITFPDGHIVSMRNVDVNQIITIDYDMIMVEEPVEPVDMRLAPNPTTDIANVSFSTENPAEVLITVTNSQGAFIESIFDGNVERGVHGYSWNTQGVTSGQYFINITINGDKSSEKLVVVK